MGRGGWICCMVAQNTAEKTRLRIVRDIVVGAGLHFSASATHALDVAWPWRAQGAGRGVCIHTIAIAARHLTMANTLVATSK